LIKPLSQKAAFSSSQFPGWHPNSVKPSFRLEIASIKSFLFNLRARACPAK